MMHSTIPFQRRFKNAGILKSLKNPVVKAIDFTYLTQHFPDILEEETLSTPPRNESSATQFGRLSFGVSNKKTEGERGKQSHPMLHDFSLKSPDSQT